MRGKTILASMVTLTFLCGFVFATMTGLAISMREIDILPAIGLGIGATIVWSFLVWLISPFVMDLVQRWIYSARPMTIEELTQYRPAVASFVQQVCQKHRIKLPRLKFIDDLTPQAYCYGSYANNARLVTTRGLMHYLDDEELKADYGHAAQHSVESVRHRPQHPGPEQFATGLPDCPGCARLLVGRSVHAALSVADAGIRGRSVRRGRDREPQRAFDGAHQDRLRSHQARAHALQPEVPRRNA